MRHLGRHPVLHAPALVLMLLLLMPGAQAGAQAGSGPQDAGEDALLASKAGMTVTRADVDDYLLGLEPELRAPTLASTARLAELVNGLLARKILLRDARAAGIQEQRKVQVAMRRVSDDMLIQHWLEQYGIDNQQGDIEQLAREEYLANPEKYTLPATLDVSHILIGIEQRTLAEAEAISKQLRARIVAGELDFIDAVAEYSDDPGAVTNHGSYPAMRRGQMVKEFEDAAFALQQGEISQPVQTRYGFHLILLQDSQPERLPAYTEVADRIRRNIGLKLRNQARNGYQEGTRAMLPDVNEAALRDLVEDYIAQHPETTDR